jgi:hypothetical protein
MTSGGKVTKSFLHLIKDFKSSSDMKIKTRPVVLLGITVSFC